MKNKIVVRISEKKTAGRMIDFFMLTAAYGELYLHSWEYTPLGTIEGATGKSLAEALGSGDVEVTLAIA